MELKPFMDLLKRANRSQFKSFLLHNRMLIQCYDVREDSDIGFHYILHIPNEDPFEDEFYDEELILHTEEIIEKYNEGHKLLLAKKKEEKAKPKEVIESGRLLYDKNKRYLQLQFTLRDTLVTSYKIPLEWPIRPDSRMVENIIITLDNITDRIKPNGLGVTMDAYRTGLYYRAFNNPQVTYAHIRLGKEQVRIPLYKSMFQGQKNLEECYVSVLETNMKDIYQYTIHMKKNQIIEQFIGYIQNF